MPAFDCAVTDPLCRLCGAPLRHSLVDLGCTPLANSFITAEQAARGEDRAYPLHARVCERCLLVQVETRTAVDQVEAIARVDGIDGVFVGPSDLAASLGYLGQPAHEDVMGVIEDTFKRIRACGKPAGFLTPDQAIARRAIAAGSVFTAIGIDGALLARGSESLLAQFKSSL